MAITINNVRFSYCNLLQAVTKPGQTEAKFSVTVLVPKTNTAAKAAIDAAVRRAERPLDDMTALVVSIVKIPD